MKCYLLCVTCDFFMLIGGTAQGECRKTAPGPATEETSLRTFPIMSVNECCGEHSELRESRIHYGCSQCNDWERRFRETLDKLKAAETNLHNKTITINAQSETIENLKDDLRKLESRIKHLHEQNGLLYEKWQQELARRKLEG